MCIWLLGFSLPKQSQKSDQDFWDCLGTKKPPSYNRRNIINGQQIAHLIDTVF